MLPPARFHSNITLSNFPNNDRSEATLNRISLSRMQLRDLRGTKSHCIAIYVNSRRETPRDAQCYTNKGKSKDNRSGLFQAGLGKTWYAGGTTDLRERAESTWETHTSNTSTPYSSSD